MAEKQKKPHPKNFFTRKNSKGSFMSEEYIQVSSIAIDEVNRQSSAPKQPIKFKMVCKHAFLQGIWDEWHRVGKFPDAEGGIEGRNKAYGCKWRKHIYGQKYYRTSCIVEAITAYARNKNIKPPPSACQAMNLWYLECKRSVEKMVTKCEEKGLLKGKKGK
jgi:hypothetical protein